MVTILLFALLKFAFILIDATIEKQDEAVTRASLTSEVEHKVKQQLNQVLNDAQVN